MAHNDSTTLNTNLDSNDQLQSSYIYISTFENQIHTVSKRSNTDRNFLNKGTQKKEHQFGNKVDEIISSLIEISQSIENIYGQQNFFHTSRMKQIQS